MSVEDILISSVGMGFWIAGFSTGAQTGTVTA